MRTMRDGRVGHGREAGSAARASPRQRWIERPWAAAPAGKSATFPAAHRHQPQAFAIGEAKPACPDERGVLDKLVVDRLHESPPTLSKPDEVSTLQESLELDPVSQVEDVSVASNDDGEQ